MAYLIQLRKSLASEWTSVNPILADGEPGVERDTKKMKLGDGITAWNLLPYTSPGPVGPQGEKGDFSYADDLIGVSTSNLTLQANVHSIAATAGKSWVPGMWVTVAYTADATKYMIGQCISYNSVSGVLVLNVSDAAVYGTGTFTNWTLSYAASAGTSIIHANSHLTGGFDELPIATNVSSGLLSPADFNKLFNLGITGAFIGDAEPVGMPTGSVWFCTSDLVIDAPIISPIYPQYHLLNTAFTVNVFLGDGYDVNLVSLGVSNSSNTAIVPVSALTVRGYGGSRFIDVSARGVAGSSVITLLATNQSGLQTSMTFPIYIVTQAYTITASSSANGDIFPEGAILVPQTGSTTFTPVANSGYALSNFVVDGVTITGVDSYTFNNVSAAHTIVGNFAVGYTIIAASIGNGTITPSGNVGAVSGQNKTFNFSGNTGYEPDKFFIDGGGAQDASSGTYTFTTVSTNHNISVNFKTLSYTVSWSGLLNGTIAGTASGFADVDYNQAYSFSVVPVPDYEIASLVVDGVTKPIAASYTIPAVIHDQTVNATFRVQIPSQVTGVSCVVTNATTNTVTWSMANRASVYIVYWSTTAPADAEALISTGTAINSNGDISITHTPIDSSIIYYYTVLASNSTGRAILGSAVVDNTVSVPNVTITSLAVASTQLTASWGAVTEATAYDIYYSSDYTDSTLIKAHGTKVTGATSPYTITGLTDYITYNVIVIGRNTHKESLAGIVKSQIPEPTICVKLTTADPLVSNGNLQINKGLVTARTGVVSVYFYDDLKSFYLPILFLNADQSRTISVGVRVRPGISVGTHYSFTIPYGAGFSESNEYTSNIPRSLGWHKVSTKNSGSATDFIKIDNTTVHTGAAMSDCKIIEIMLANSDPAVGTVTTYLDKIAIDGELMTAQDDLSGYWGLVYSANGTITLDTSFYCPLPI